MENKKPSKFGAIGILGLLMLIGGIGGTFLTLITINSGQYSSKPSSENEIMVPPGLVIAFLIILAVVGLVLLIIGYKKNKPLVDAYNQENHIVSNKRNSECPGFSYEHDGAQLIIKAKYGYEKNGFGPGIHEMYKALPNAFQEIINDGFYKFVKCDMANKTFVFETTLSTEELQRINDLRKELDTSKGDKKEVLLRQMPEFYSETPKIVLYIYEEDVGEEYTEYKVPVYKDVTKSRIVNHTVSESGYYTNQHGFRQYASKGSVVAVRETYTEKVLDHYEDRVYQAYDHILDYQYVDTKKPVYAEDGNRLMYIDHRKRLIKSIVVK